MNTLTGIKKFQEDNLSKIDISRLNKNPWDLHDLLLTIQKPSQLGNLIRSEVDQLIKRHPRYGFMARLDYSDELFSEFKDSIIDNTQRFPLFMSMLNQLEESNGDLSIIDTKISTTDDIKNILNTPGAYEDYYATMRSINQLQSFVSTTNNQLESIDLVYLGLKYKLTSTKLRLLLGYMIEKGFSDEILIDHMTLTPSADKKLKEIIEYSRGLYRLRGLTINNLGEQSRTKYQRDNNNTLVHLQTHEPDLLMKHSCVVNFGQISFDKEIKSELNNSVKGFPIINNNTNKCNEINVDNCDDIRLLSDELSVTPSNIIDYISNKEGIFQKNNKVHLALGVIKNNITYSFTLQLTEEIRSYFSDVRKRA